MAETQHSLVPKPKYLQEDNLAEEFKELIPTLPMEKGWVGSYLHQYQGFWYATRHLQGVLTCQSTLRLMIRISSSLPLLNQVPHGSRHGLLPCLTALLHTPSLCLIAKIREESTCKVVYLCRDPKDTLVSLWHFTNKIKPESRGTNSLEESYEKFCRGVSLYGPFWEHVLGYWKESLERPKKVMFFRFEEMKLQPGFYLKELAEFVGCPFSKEEESEGVLDDILNLCSFENLSNLEVNKTGKLSSGEENKAFFRQGEVGDWKNILTAEMIQRLNTITEMKLAKHKLYF
ncbi:Sulfotransferase domain [Sesbania bispinosa]|nr:Sulfotransferase domain [Sesbania bispinosa]